jgi:hypothetical protein
VCIRCRREADREKYSHLTAQQKQALVNQVLEAKRKRLDKWEDQMRYAIMAQHRMKSYSDDPSYDLVPFRMWLLGAIRRYGGNQALANTVGVDEKVVRRFSDGYEWVNGYDAPTPIQGVHMTMVDQFGVGVGDPDLVNRLYPYVGADDET